MSVKANTANAAGKIFQQYCEQYNAIELLHLATTDGFPVCNYNGGANKFDEDKMAAAASTLCSVSGAVTKQLLGKTFRITYIEADHGNVAFISLAIHDQDYVLGMSVDSSMNVGQLRVIINRVATALIESLR